MKKLSFLFVALFSTSIMAGVGDLTGNYSEICSNESEARCIKETAQIATKAIQAVGNTYQAECKFKRERSYMVVPFKGRYIDVAKCKVGGAIYKVKVKSKCGCHDDKPAKLLNFKVKRQR